MNNCNQAIELSENIAVPSISSGAYKVMVSIKQWAGRKTDKKASAEVNEANHAEAKASSVHKSLLGSCPELAAIQSLAGRVRNHHLYVYTMPWDDAGWRLLTTLLMPKFYAAMTEHQNEFYRLVDVFIASYANAKLEAQRHYTGLGDMFDESDYPTEEELRAKFSFDIDEEPVPESGDWRVDVQREAMDDLKERFESRYERKINGATNNVWEKLHKALTKLSERIDYTDEEKKKVFKSSTVDSLVDLVDILDAFNITGDPKMTQMAVDLKNAMRGISPEALREDAGLRAETKKALDDAIRNLPSLM